jgi:hypothetical protein
LFSSHDAFSFVREYHAPTKQKVFAPVMERELGNPNTTKHVATCNWRVLNLKHELLNRRNMFAGWHIPSIATVIPSMSRTSFRFPITHLTGNNHVVLATSQRAARCVPARRGWR